MELSVADRCALQHKDQMTKKLQLLGQLEWLLLDFLNQACAIFLFKKYENININLYNNNQINTQINGY